MDLRLWVVDLGPHPPDPTVWWPLLDPVERVAAGAERRAGDRARYVVRHAVLRTILGDALGLAPAAVLLDRAPCPLCGGPHGRPIVAGGAVAFSLASTPDVVAVAVAVGPAAVEVGVDVETFGRVRAADLAAALHPRERAALDRRPRGDRDLAAVRCWTRKEALLEGRGTSSPVGCTGSVDPAGVHVGLAPSAVDGAGGRTITSAASAGWTLVDLPLVPLTGGPGHRCAVVTLAYRTGRHVTVDVVETGFAGLMRGREPPPAEPAGADPVDVRTSHRSAVG